MGRADAGGAMPVASPRQARRRRLAKIWSYIVGFMSGCCLSVAMLAEFRRYPYDALQHRMSQPGGLGGLSETLAASLGLLKQPIIPEMRPICVLLRERSWGRGLGFVSKFGWGYYYPNGLIDPFNRLSSATLSSIVFGRAKLNCEPTLNRVRRGLSTVGAGSV